MEARAVIDIGTNSVKLLVARALGGDLEVIDDRTTVTRLGEGLRETGLIGEAAAERTLAALRAFVSAAREQGALSPLLVGTMGLRTARNARSFLERAEAECGAAVEVVSGEEEARLSYRGALSAVPEPRGEVTVFDIGGGSTEIVRGEGARVRSAASLPMGVRTLTEGWLRSDPVTPGETHRLSIHIRSVVEPFRGRSGTLIGVGGTACTIAAVMLGMRTFDPGRLRGVSVPLAEVERQISLFRDLRVEERKTVPGLPEERADVILAGAAIVLGVLECAEAGAFTVSDRGLRHGVLLEGPRPARP
jgi:exopolyphosphatase/guanosine-5'-triphosphate,3'-diphosphate pyrophosphatase